MSILLYSEDLMLNNNCHYLHTLTSKLIVILALAFKVQANSRLEAHES